MLDLVATGTYKGKTVIKNKQKTSRFSRYRMFHPITKTDHYQNGPKQKRTIEIKNVNFLNKYDILCIIAMILYVFNYMY